MTARVHSGRVQEHPRRREANIIPGDNLLTEKPASSPIRAHRDHDYNEIKRIFDQY